MQRVTVLKTLPQLCCLIEHAGASIRHLSPQILCITLRNSQLFLRATDYISQLESDKGMLLHSFQQSGMPLRMYAMAPASFQAQRQRQSRRWFLALVIMYKPQQTQLPACDSCS